MKIVVAFLLTLAPVVLFSKENKTTESQPQILFEHQDLTSAQNKRELIVKFNTAVLYLEKKRYKEAIVLFKEASPLLKIASFLNIGISYYKLNSENNAYLYLKKIYDIKELQFKDRYSYFSAAYYLYKITNDRVYLNEITKIGSKAKRLSEHEKRLMVDTLILQKKYKYALELLDKTKIPAPLKKALLYIKLKNYQKAKYYLDKAYAKSAGDEKKNDILWFQLYRDLKANDLVNLSEDIMSIEDRKKIFHSHQKLKLTLFFNKNKLTAKDYFEHITNLTEERKLDFVYYFAPYIFEDTDQIDVDAKSGFIIRDKNSLNDLNTMVDYNAKFLALVKIDPIERVNKLQKMISKEYDTNAYKYYNLALTYVQVYDFNNAYKYFKKAYSLEHGNKLYSVMTLLTAKRLKIKIDKKDKEIMTKNLVSKKGTFKYLAQYLYKIFENPSMKLDKTSLSLQDKKSIFFRALYMLDNMKKNGIKSTEPLLVEFDKDPLVKLLKLIARDKGESDYNYISRLQDELPRIYNNNFLEGSLVITDFYLETLRALGLFNRTDFNIPHHLTPTYLRLKAIVQLYSGEPRNSIKIIEYIQNKYNFHSIDSYYILIAALMYSGQQELAFVTLSEIEFIYGDKDAKFLSGVALLQELKLNTAPQYFEHKLKGKMVDFKLTNFDNYLESL